MDLQLSDSESEAEESTLAQQHCQKEQIPGPETLSSTDQLIKNNQDVLNPNRIQKLLNQNEQSSEPSDPNNDSEEDQDQDQVVENSDSSDSDAENQELLQQQSDSDNSAASVSEDSVNHRQDKKLEFDRRDNRNKTYQQQQQQGRKMRSLKYAAELQKRQNKTKQTKVQDHEDRFDVNRYQQYQRNKNEIHIVDSQRTTSTQSAYQDSESDQKRNRYRKKVHQNQQRQMSASLTQNCFWVILLSLVIASPIYLLWNFHSTSQQLASTAQNQGQTQSQNQIDTKIQQQSEVHQLQVQQQQEWQSDYHSSQVQWQPKTQSDSQSQANFKSQLIQSQQSLNLKPSSDAQIIMNSIVHAQDDFQQSQNDPINDSQSVGQQGLETQSQDDPSFLDVTEQESESEQKKESQQFQEKQSESQQQSESESEQVQYQVKKVNKRNKLNKQSDSHFLTQQDSDDLKKKAKKNVVLDVLKSHANCKSKSECTDPCVLSRTSEVESYMDLISAPPKGQSETDPDSDTQYKQIGDMSMAMVYICQKKSKPEIRYALRVELHDMSQIKKPLEQSYNPDDFESFEDAVNQNRNEAILSRRIPDLVARSFAKWWLVNKKMITNPMEMKRIHQKEKKFEFVAMTNVDYEGGGQSSSKQSTNAKSKKKKINNNANTAAAANEGQQAAAPESPESADEAPPPKYLDIDILFTLMELGISDLNGYWKKINSKDIRKKSEDGMYILSDPHVDGNHPAVWFPDVIWAYFGLHRATRKVHYDIKPDNLLMMPDGRAVLLDFDGTMPFIRDEGMRSNDELVGQLIFTAWTTQAAQLCGELFQDYTVLDENSMKKKFKKLRRYHPGVDLYGMGLTLFENVVGSHQHQDPDESISDSNYELHSHPYLGCFPTRNKWNTDNKNTNGTLEIQALCGPGDNMTRFEQPFVSAKWGGLTKGVMQQIAILNSGGGGGGSAGTSESGSGSSSNGNVLGNSLKLPSGWDTMMMQQKDSGNPNNQLQNQQQQQQLPGPNQQVTQQTTTTQYLPGFHSPTCEPWIQQPWKPHPHNFFPKKLPQVGGGHYRLEEDARVKPVIVETEAELNGGQGTGSEGGGGGSQQESGGGPGSGVRWRRRHVKYSPLWDLVQGVTQVDLDHEQFTINQVLCHPVMIKWATQTRKLLKNVHPSITTTNTGSGVDGANTANADLPHYWDAPWVCIDYKPDWQCALPRILFSDVDAFLALEENVSYTKLYDDILFHHDRFDNHNNSSSSEKSDSVTEAGAAAAEAPSPTSSSESGLTSSSSESGSDSFSNSDSESVTSFVEDSESQGIQISERLSNSQNFNLNQNAAAEPATADTAATAQSPAPATPSPTSEANASKASDGTTPPATATAESPPPPPPIIEDKLAELYQKVFKRKRNYEDSEYVDPNTLQVLDKEKGLEILDLWEKSGIIRSYNSFINEFDKTDAQQLTGDPSELSVHELAKLQSAATSGANGRLINVLSCTSESGQYPREYRKTKDMPEIEYMKLLASNYGLKYLKFSKSDTDSGGNSVKENWGGGCMGYGC